MKNGLFFALILSSCLFAACGGGDANTQGAAAEEASQTEQTAEAADKGPSTFGEEITTDDAIMLAELPAKLENVDSLKVKIRGTVESVCQVKGCWMNVVSQDENGEPIFVKFKDYGFFVPVDITGQEVVMDGYAYREVTSVSELRHYAEDEGKSKEEIAAITEPQEELKFMASGVLVMN
ncbi:MAG: DUF4920 domain-containing protein [Bacteroidota bacterium]